MKQSSFLRSAGRTLPLVGFALLLFGCADTATSPGSDPSAKGMGSAAPLGPEAFAAALQDQGARSALLEVLRASPYSDHKVTFAELADLPSAAPLRSALGSFSGITPEDISAALHAAPATDVYFPAADDRATWTPAMAPVVAEVRGPLVGALRVWRGAGEFTDVAPRPGVDPGYLVFLHSAEPRAKRLGYQGEGTGATIQPQGEEQMGAAITRTAADGSVERIEVADLPPENWPQRAMACPPEQQDLCEGSGGSGGGGGTGQNDPVWQTIGHTYLHNFYTTGVCDNNACLFGDDNEFGILAHWQYGMVEENGGYDLTGVPATADRLNLNALLIYRKPTLQAMISIHVIEYDQTSNDDDFRTNILGPYDNLVLFRFTQTTKPGAVDANFFWD